MTGGRSSVDRTPTFVLAGIALVMSMTMGCRTTSDQVEAADQPTVPEDVVIAAAVLVGDKLAHRMVSDSAQWPAHLRNSRAIVLPDGTLRAEIGPSLSVDERPGVTRHLRRPQLVALWQRVNQLGLGDPSAGNLDGNPALVEPGPWEIVLLLEFQRSGRDWIVMDRIDLAGGPIDPERAASLEKANIRSMFRTLAALAWASDTRTDDAIRYPERYDFGPDPWARYRSRAADGGSP